MMRFVLWLYVTFIVEWNWQSGGRVWLFDFRFGMSLCDMPEICRVNWMLGLERVALRGDIMWVVTFF